MGRKGKFPYNAASQSAINQYAYYSTNDLVGATNYAWFWPSDWEYSAGQGTRHLDVRTSGFSTSGVVGVRVANACDAGGSPGTKFTFVNNCGGFSMAAYPNPAGDELIIEAEKADSTINRSQNTTMEFSVKLRDPNGKVKKTGNTKSGRIVLDISTLNIGTYYMEIKTVEKTYLQQILINR